MSEPETPLSGAPRYLAVAGATVAISVLMGLSVLRASNGASVVAVFPTGAATWGSYLLAHYLATGRVVDEGSDSREFSVPAAGRDRVGFLTGTVVMVAAVPVGIYGMHADSLPFTAGATLVFLLGYYTTHYAGSRTIL